MCGGTTNTESDTTTGNGLSPRVRGNRADGDLHIVFAGSIPACAGEPPTPSLSGRRRKVYPRVCGGTVLWMEWQEVLGGLSPRVRGNLRRVALHYLQEGSIPACAGEPQSPAVQEVVKRVYPRVCGGTSDRPIGCCRLDGLSPRVRGNHFKQGVCDKNIGSIPACAGEPRFFREGFRLFAVYPRVCGGTRIETVMSVRESGLSPRVRGNLLLFVVVDLECGSIPACAGEPRPSPRPRRPLLVYPRVCGGTCGASRRQGGRCGLSPRVRGNRILPCSWVIGWGSIPACAGEPLSDLYLFLPSLKG